MIDLTVIFLTVNLVPEAWAEYHRHVLTEAIGETPVISISRKPLKWGLNLIQTEGASVNNIYRQVLRGAKEAITPFIAIAEDDTLYHKTHFAFRPPMDTYGYDGHRWGLFTWGHPTYYWKDRISNAAMIAPRELVIEALTERFRKYPHTQTGELGKEKGMRIDRHKSVVFYPEIGMIFFSHDNGLDHLERTHRKALGAVQAYDIPHWGRADELVKHFK